MGLKMVVKGSYNPVPAVFYRVLYRIYGLCRGNGTCGLARTECVP